MVAVLTRMDRLRRMWQLANFFFTRRKPIKRAAPRTRENHRGHPEVHALEPLIQIGEVK